MLRNTNGKEWNEVPKGVTIVNSHLGVSPIFSNSPLPFFTSEVRMGQPYSPNKSQHNCHITSCAFDSIRMLSPYKSIKFRQNSPIAINKPKTLLKNPNSPNDKIDINKEQYINKHQWWLVAHIRQAVPKVSTIVPLFLHGIKVINLIILQLNLCLVYIQRYNDGWHQPNYEQEEIK